MRKLLFLALLAVHSCGPAVAQNTAVTGNVAGPNGFVWANATGHASLVCPGNAQPYIGTSPIPRDYPTVGLDGNGNFTQGLYDTSAMVDVNQAPISCNYVYSFTEQCGITSFKTNPLTGVTGTGPVNLTSQIAATAVNMSAQCTPNATGFFEQTVPSSATPVFNSPGDTLFNFTLTQNVTSSSFVTAVVPNHGRVFQINICQDSTGNWTMAWPANVSLPSGYSLTFTAKSCSPVAFRTIDGGATWQGWQVGGSGGGGTTLALLTNGTPNPVQNTLNNIAGSGMTITPDGSGGVTYSSNAAVTVGTVGELQKTDGSGNHVATNLTETGKVLTSGDTNSGRGPNPSVDITAPPFYARVINPNTIPTGTVTCSAGLTTIPVLGGLTSLQTNDGIAIPGCGATETMTQPSAPTVTPSVPTALTGTGYTTAGGAGGTTDCYKLLPIDFPASGVGGGGWGPISSAGCTSTGNSSLGAATTTITGPTSISGTTKTYPVASTADLAVGEIVRISGTGDDGEWGGVVQITAIGSGTFSVTTGISNSYYMSSTSVSTGTVFKWYANALTFSAPTDGATTFYAIYRSLNGGAYSLVHITYPISLSGITDTTYLTWEDYGTTMQQNLSNPPWWIPTTPPASTQKQALAHRRNALSPKNRDCCCWRRWQP